MSAARWRRLLTALRLFAVVELLTTIGMQMFSFGALPGVDNYFTFFRPSQRIVLQPIGPNRYRTTIGNESIAYREGGAQRRIANAGLAWMLLLAGVILLARPNAPQARVLSLLLILLNIGLGFQGQNWATPLPSSTPVLLRSTDFRLIWHSHFLPHVLDSSHARCRRFEKR